jgi:MFS family permease
VAARAPLSNRAFRALWAAGFVSDAGDWLLLIALPIVVFKVSGSALGTAAAFAAELGPGIVLAPLAGRLADALDRRSLMIGLSALQAVALLPLLLVHDGRGLPIVYAVIVVQASLAALFDPAKNALVPVLVDPRQLVSANSLMGLGAAAGRLVGGPLGGLLLAAGSLRAVIVADAASFAIAAVLIACLRPTRDGTPSRASRDAGRRGDGGLRAVLRNRGLAAALLVTLIASVAQGIFVVLFIVFVARRLGGGSSEIGLLRGVQAIGAIAGGLMLTLAGGRWRPIPLAAVAAAAFGAVDLTIWNGPLVTRSEAMYVALFVLAGAPGVILETAGISFLQRASADRERGRVFAALGLAETTGQALGIAAAGLLTAPLGLMVLLDGQAALYLGAGALIAALAWEARPSRAAHRRRVGRQDGPAAARRASTGSSAK